MMTKININLYDRFNNRVLNRTDIRELFLDHEPHDTYTLDFRGVEVSFSSVHEMMIYEKIYDITIIGVSYDYIGKYMRLVLAMKK